MKAPTPSLYEQGIALINRDRHPDPRPLPDGFEPENFDITSVDYPISLVGGRKRFYEQVEQLGPANFGRGCAVWKGPCFKDGLPYFHFRGKTWTARRFMYTVDRGPIEPGGRIISTCGYIDCVSMFHVKQSIPPEVLFQRKTRLTPREKRLCLVALRKGYYVDSLSYERIVPVDEVARTYGLPRELVAPLGEEVIRELAPKPLTRIKRARIANAIAVGWTDEDIAKKYLVNEATVYRVRDELRFE